MLRIMKFSALFCTLLSIASVSAKVFNVTVGADDKLQYDPPCIWGAVAGDQVVFTFFPKNHTVTQSTFTTPCQRESETSFDSGFMPVSANATSNPTVTFTLDEQSASTPQWFYCRQKNPESHCNKGMVFAINPTPSKTFAQFQQNAINDVSNSTTGGAPCTTSSAPGTTATPSSSESTGYNGSSSGYSGSSSGYNSSSSGYSGSSGDSGSSSGSSGSNGTVHSILVGDNETLTFSPSSIQAVAGDTIEFTFVSKNHSATQSTFTDPCNLAPGGVNSGFQPVPANSSTTMQWSITLDAQSASGPLWFFCAQTNPAVHCHAGMVFAINANVNKSFTQFQMNAMNSANSSASTDSPSAAGNTASPISSPAYSSSTPGPTSAGSSAANINAASNGVLGIHSSLNTVMLMVIVGLVASFSF
jgi:plastocyanin